MQSVGTAASLRGNRAKRCAAATRQIKIVAVEPAESAVLSGGQPGAHKIDGIGAGFVVPLWRDDIADQIERVSTEEARRWLCGWRGRKAFRRNLHRRQRRRRAAAGRTLGPDATIVTVMCDTGMKYLKSFSGSARAP